MAISHSNNHIVCHPHPVLAQIVRVEIMTYIVRTAEGDGIHLDGEPKDMLRDANCCERGKSCADETL